MYQQFKELQLQVIELPIEMVGNQPLYSAYIRELPTITAEGHSRKEVYRLLMEGYQRYVESLEIEESTEEMTSSLLTVDQLLKYYDGEVFDGFEIDLDVE